MRFVRARLVGAGSTVAPAGCEADLLHDLFWAHTGPADGLEHVRVRPAGDGMEVVLFLFAVTDTAALDRANVLLTLLREPLAAHGYTAVIPTV
ncbi:hypothetical protein J7W19_27815 [Streptomyces mobaraensis NBRC 13819 = DSM 40847]|uniref:Uncharacterized protein n=1 Tax=Streptomyces mobaraensis (strain ATCC 29032 / DSM 40847 / JCM 4168 / NBRC 13819 / NCIMB 11159 / IPCR 16-22) TaxID=1223523 RepID=M3AAC6_STRM1|nr:hypothetical protein [Streptomyces mobaraensis]EMF02139.1 hypothetical protein H340_02879 [Streptomyces mobaraensis NBRC 13819 = DSM 40847]QTT76678.1 hypothetical protein J7W19_27815 [Streptomyces mobaraensis NBRC 13819 = DSM 40847]